MVEKRIISRQHLDAFLNSQTHTDIVDFANALNQSAIGVTLRQDCLLSETVKALLHILDEVDSLASSIPPVDNEKSRFGNPAFRTFYDEVARLSSEWHNRTPNFPAEQLSNVTPYLLESWGNRTRIDYGSGMELNFLCWLLCLQKLGLIKNEDYTAVVTKVFWRYMQVMRRLQSSYWLEPAGSHGAYGLDDYHFLPFVFGSAQLRGHKYIKPKAIHDKELVDEYAKDYMYLACIQFVDSIKTASLRWHSPMLDDISAVKTWDKVNEGMIKMYKAEVLAKLPVAQHIFFGALLPFPDTPIDTSTHDDTVHVDNHGHLHVQGEGFGDCCGIPIPSAFAAAKEEQHKRTGAPPMSSNVRIIPFD